MVSHPPPSDDGQDLKGKFPQVSILVQVLVLVSDDVECYLFNVIFLSWFSLAEFSTVVMSAVYVY